MRPFRTSPLAVLCFSFFLLGCERWGLQAPRTFLDKGISLGSSKREVTRQLGQAKMELNYKSNENRVSVMEYDSVQLDYTPVYERDDMGILPPRSGIFEKRQKDYRLVFINDRLYSIEDFIQSRYYCLPEIESETFSLLEEIRKRQ